MDNDGTQGTRPHLKNKEWERIFGAVGLLIVFGSYSFRDMYSEPMKETINSIETQEQAFLSSSEQESVPPLVTYLSTKIEVLDDYIRWRDSKEGVRPLLSPAQRVEVAVMTLQGYNLTFERLHRLADTLPYRTDALTVEARDLQSRLGALRVTVDEFKKITDNAAAETAEKKLDQQADDLSGALSKVATDFEADIKKEEARLRKSYEFYRTTGDLLFALGVALAIYGKLFGFDAEGISVSGADNVTD